MEHSVGNKALVLTGGSVRGAYQAGALEAVIDRGYKPNIIRGISAGALNAAYLTSEYASTGSFTTAAMRLTGLWRDKVKSPKDLIRTRYTKAFIEIIFNRFKSVADTKPLRKIIYNAIDPAKLMVSGLDFEVGTVDISTGNLLFKDSFDPKILDFILASAAIPVIMPPSIISGSTYYDGGLRDSAPLKSAIKAGADEIVIISSSPLKPAEKQVNSGNLFELMQRVVDIFFNEMLLNDLAELKRINKQVLQGRLPGKRYINYKIIAPKDKLGINLTKFNRVDIAQINNLGYTDGAMALWDN